MCMGNYRDKKKGIIRFLLAALLFVFGYVNILPASEEPLSFIHYTNKDGLPSSYVKSITQDHYGFIWLATRIDVCRFDGRNFQTFPAYNEEGESFNLYSNKIFSCADSTLVCRTNEGSYFYFDFELECFKPYKLLNDVLSVQSVEPVGGGYWICRDNKLYFLDSRNGMLTEIKDMVTFGSIPPQVVFTDVRERNGDLIALTDDRLIILFDFKLSKIKTFKLPDYFSGLSISSFYVDAWKNVWVGEEATGLFRLNLETGDNERYSKNSPTDKRLSHNMVHTFVEDKIGRLWIGTEGGLSIWHPETNKFSYCRYELENPSGLNTDPVYDAFCDDNGNIWLGTYFGGINFWDAEKSFFKTWKSGTGNRQLGGNVVSCLREDGDGNLWIGLEDMGLNKLDLISGEIQKYTSNTDGKGLSYNNLHDLLFVTDKELWIATYTGGINILNTITGRYRYINQKSHPGLPSDNVYAFLPLGDSIFIATTGGIAIYNLNTSNISIFHPEELNLFQFESICRTRNRIWFSCFEYIFYYDLIEKKLNRFSNVTQSWSNNFVKSDSKGRIWVGSCYNGLYCYDETIDSIRFFNPQNGFPVSWIFSVEEAKDGWYWASSDKGLVRFNPEKDVYVLYDSNSGIPFNQFNYRASYKDNWGNIYFGGNNGMVSFNENDNPNVAKKLDVFFTGLQLFNKVVSPLEEKSPLKKSINETELIKFDYNQNVFTLEFSALSYSNNGNCQYAYYLENFEENWNYVGNRDFATYTNLSPGTYFFHVKGSVGNIADETNFRTLKIVVKPPFWLSIWAFIVYFILVWVVSILIYTVGKSFEKSKALVAMERREKEHANEIHQVKLEFFTNISHELKTPLTLIIGPLNAILKEEKLSPFIKKRLMGIEKNAQRLFNLINQLLEFRKIETGREKLQVARWDLDTISFEIADSFQSVAENKNIEFTVKFNCEERVVWLDVNKVDKIICNLLSNAFKYTPSGGKVELTFDIVQRDKKRNRKPLYDLLITVSDTGKGIKREMLDKVFDRFFRIDKEALNEKGSGIGLAYLKSLVIVHRGSIEVKSEDNKGSVFKVLLPVSQSDYSNDELESSSIQYIPSPEEIEVETEEEKIADFDDATGFSHDPVVLLVEDNSELLDFMKDILQDKYQVYTAQNGIDALGKMKTIFPDMVISDIMMPELDGLELTKHIKSDIATSHIPVILLTAKSGAKNIYKGLKTGADLYIEKPFVPEILEQNIENILNTRKMLIQRFRDNAFASVSDVAHSESDKVFIEKMTGIIKKNISDPNLDVTFLVREMGMSRSLIHIKLKGLLQCSTTEFIRSIRLREAVKLLSDGTYNISEAAYETGFSSPTYFTRRFKEYFGKSPREYFNV
ncbi:MAG: response regulator [Prolixibacteraceae bacterium]|nr:response regulator [Prolixibacteraceae bacterium]